LGMDGMKGAATRSSSAQAHNKYLARELPFRER
jgi:hypothetical protein